jgi:hypothetical protein
MSENENTSKNTLNQDDDNAQVRLEQSPLKKFQDQIKKKELKDYPCCID